jgi:phenylacetate-CoA ligase
MTSVAEEKEEQARWRLLPQHAGATAFNELLEAEFLPEEAQRARESRIVSALVAFAAAEIPYYGDLLGARGLTPANFTSVRDLARLPELTKTTIRAEGARLAARRLPQGDRVFGTSTSSGTTGEPTAVLQSERSRFIHRLLVQRQMRWYRFDPMGTMAWFRTAKDIRMRDNRPLPDGRTLVRASWSGIGAFFATGPFLGFSKSNPTERKLAWLEEHRPDYLLAASGQLEHLALALQDRPPIEGLRGLRAVSEPLTAGMERRIEAAFHAPVHISYGMDEVGWIATRCREGGRYHVHTEHCLVELVDGGGDPAPAGAHGRILVTVIGNLAMPLLRYVTDDVALAVEGPCPCGRTLPSFGPIVGRWTQMAPLPEGTRARADRIRGAMEELPPELLRPVREYKIHQHRDGSFELMIVAAGPIPASLGPYVENRLREAGLGDAPLRVTKVEKIPLARSGKFFYFTSDFAPPPAPAEETGDAAARAAPRPRGQTPG